MYFLAKLEIIGTNLYYMKTIIRMCCDKVIGFVILGMISAKDGDHGVFPDREHAWWRLRGETTGHKPGSRLRSAP